MKKVVALVQLAAVAALCAFVVMLFANEPDAPAAPRDNVVADSRADGSADASAPDGKALFSSRCAGCHGSDGGGGVGPKLAGLVRAKFPDVADQVDVVRNGRGGMPSFGGRLSDEEITAIVEYTRSL